jgi:hypothetical protein
MYLRVLGTGAMAQVNAELEHLEAIFQNVLAETGIDFSFLGRFGWQVKKYEYPHNSVGV